MKMKYVLMAFASMFMVACSDENEVVPSSVEDGAYKIVINLSSLAGDAQTSRTGSDIPPSGFGDTYNNNSVFIHAVNENGSEIGSIKIPVSGSSVKFTVNVTTEDNSVTISSSSSESASSLEMGTNDKIYFSSIAAENWEATRASWQGFTPISKSAAFTNGESTESELYRSPEGNGESYTIDQLIGLDNGTLTMYRKCSAYSLAVMFSDLQDGGSTSGNMTTYTFNKEDWECEFTGNVAYMYGKGYIGGFFPEVYNVYSGTSSWKQNSDGETTPEAGYYVTNNQIYTQLGEMNEAQIVDGQIHNYTGCGFKSVDYIRTPVVESGGGTMSVYVLFKPSPTKVTDLTGDFNKEEEDYGKNVRMVKVTLGGMTPTMNVVSAITLVFDYRRLKDVFNNSESVYLTRTTEGGIPIIPMEPDVIIYQ